MTKFDALMVELNRADSLLTTVINQYAQQAQDLEQMRGSLRRLRAYLRAGAEMIGADIDDDMHHPHISSLEEKLKASVHRTQQTKPTKQPKRRRRQS